MSHSTDRIRVHDRMFRPYISQHEIDEMTSRIAANINAAFAGEELTVLVILKGAILFASDLIRKISVPVSIEFTRASSYGNGMTHSGTTRIDGLTGDIAGRNVMIIEDIVDSGATLRELVKHISGLEPKSITITALLSKPEVHKDSITIDYVGREIAPDFVVGYGMDYAGYGRQLDAIWVVCDDETT